MTASPDDAAASSTPPRVDGGPAAPSFLGTTGRRTPEKPPMPQHPPAHDETQRMRADGADGLPALDGAGLAYDSQHDDTGPVPRDWLRGAPARRRTGSSSGGASPATGTPVTAE